MKRNHQSDCYLQTNVKKQLEYLLIAWSCIYQGGQMTAWDPTHQNRAKNKKQDKQNPNRAKNLNRAEKYTNRAKNPNRANKIQTGLKRQNWQIFSGRKMSELQILTSMRCLSTEIDWFLTICKLIAHCFHLHLKFDWQCIAMQPK